MQKNLEIQHKYSLYIGSLCNIAFPMARFKIFASQVSGSLTLSYESKRTVHLASEDALYLHRDFTGIRENLNAMKRSIEICLL